MSASLDISRLENIHTIDGKTIAQCPACAKAEGDAKGDHLFIKADGRYGCIQFPGSAGAEHRKEIFALIGIVEPKTTCKRLAPAKQKKTHPDPNAAAKAALWSLNQKQNRVFKEVKRWPYQNDTGELYAYMIRFEPEGDPASKTFRPIHKTAGGWQTGDPAKWFPYMLPEILKSTGDVFICEGEKAADAGRSIGLVCTTSAHGAKSPNKTNWRSITGRDVDLLPDNDPAGRGYAQDIMKISMELNPAPKIKVIQLPGLSEKGDLYDFCENHDGQEPETIRDEILKLAEQAPYSMPSVIQPDNVSRLGTERDPLDAAKEGQPLARTDTGLAERFAFYHAAEVAYQTESGAWKVWDGKRWAHDSGLVEIRRRLAETARKIKDECSALPESMGAQSRMDYFRYALSCEQIGRMDAAARLAPSLGLARSLAMFDADPMQFCVKNGTIDLRTGTLHPHKREEFITRVSPVAFIPDATDPTFRQFINHATTGDAELESYLQRAAGYTLSGHIHEKCLFIVYCTATDTGKTCFVTGLLTVLGEYGMTIGFDSILEPDHGGQPNYDLAKLCGARLAVASETKPGRKFAAELIKQLTGGDTLRAREIRQSSVEFRPTHKLWLSTNHAPMLSDGGDEATWNRLRRVPFNNQIPRADRDPRILAALSDPNSPAARAFLAWAVAGAVLWSEQGLGTCAAVEESTTAYQSETDPLLDFIEDSCELHRDFCTKSADLRRVYEDWSSKNGQRYPLSRQRFAAVLLKHGCKEHRGHGGVRSWLGIGIKATG
ncbi:MAG: phage/plasmid primase, P4 family [Kiritimatiellia bacterium]|nr:phage/plasmid primase, P4 family [Kiritimatiellia bacterium]